MVDKGEQAPNFKLYNDRGEEEELYNYKGKIIVLYFYPRAMTTGCTREAVRFNELLDEFHKHGAVVIGVSTDPVDKIAKFKKKHNLKFTLLSDPEGKVVKLYGVVKKGTKRLAAERTTFIIDQDMRIVEVLRNIRPAEKHADLALEIVKKLSK
ncbi:alkyl hydroperoxide reductase/ Thiol specific antioxidant/ Mal allergen [Staphylothermus marinus F1]|uniref:thioredoxin-dependent peroxiredoxin n=1 Tax=Staphylothermus marinus (strain ATCC 43588 / DSM 3639 / JCM 9404 / F1) TaxID=399550 RepID=A3DLJ4_STAMF|nr:peroxiredoxin [Staphylothermus marinus]ABN69504.1 alkyl hydroperoxide reductase/ Thiol specific antioxidant/ Mal allergen [Staphylothermus marinus F1]